MASKQPFLGHLVHRCRPWGNRPHVRNHALFFRNFKGMNRREKGLRTLRYKPAFEAVMNLIDNAKTAHEKALLDKCLHLLLKAKCASMQDKWCCVALLPIFARQTPLSPIFVKKVGDNDFFLDFIHIFHIMQSPLTYEVWGVFFIR